MLYHCIRKFAQHSCAPTDEHFCLISNLIFCWDLQLQLLVIFSLIKSGTLSFVGERKNRGGRDSCINRYNKHPHRHTHAFIAQSIFPGNTCSRWLREAFLVLSICTSCHCQILVLLLPLVDFKYCLAESHFIFLPGKEALITCDTPESYTEAAQHPCVCPDGSSAHCVWDEL